MFILFPITCRAKNYCTKATDCLFLKSIVVINQPKHQVPIPIANSLNGFNLPTTESEPSLTIEIRFLTVEVYMWQLKMAQIGSLGVPEKFIYDQIIHEMRKKYKCPFADKVLLSDIVRGG